MKISRKQLAYLLREVGVTGSISEWEAHATAMSLDEGELEIEGYERTEGWIPFHPTEPYTWPPEGEGVMAVIELYDHEAQELYTTVINGLYNPKEGLFYQPGIASAYTSHANIKAWRHLPKPPKKIYSRIKSNGK